jgi:signal transduction histidine kinase
MTSGSQSFSSLVHSIAVSTQLAIQASWVAVLVRSDDGEWFVTAADTRPDAPFIRLLHNSQVPKWLEMEQAVLRSNHPFLDEPRVPFDEWDRALFRTFEAELAAPVMGEYGLLGLVVAGKGAAGSHYPVSHLNFFKSMADMAGMAVQGHVEKAPSRRDDGDEILRRMAHDLKGPLATILTYIDLVRQNKAGNLNDDQVERLDKAGRSGRRLLKLLNDFVDFARLRAGSLGLERSEFELSSLMAEVTDSLEPGMDARGQRLRYTGQDDSVVLWADRARTVQIVSTLIANASRYSPDGVPVDVEAWPEGSVLHFRVLDRGRGMDDDQVRSVFEPFSQQQHSQRSEADQAETGSGLGLVLARGLIELHGGKIRVTSRVGEGTVAEFDLPVVLSGDKRKEHVA